MTTLPKGREPIIHSPLVRAAARGVRAVASRTGRALDRGRAQAVGQASRRARQVLLCDILATRDEVDRVDVRRTRRFGAAPRVSIRVWINTAVAGIDPEALVGSRARGFATTSEAADAQRAGRDSLAGHHWRGEEAGEGPACERARHLLDGLTRMAWEATRDEGPALEVVLVAVELERPWAVGLEALGGDTVLTPAAAAQRYRSSEK